MGRSNWAANQSVLWWRVGGTVMRVTPAGCGSWGRWVIQRARASGAVVTSVAERCNIEGPLRRLLDAALVRKMIGGYLVSNIGPAIRGTPWVPGNTEPSRQHKKVQAVSGEMRDLLGSPPHNSV